MADWLVIALRAPMASFAFEPGNSTRKTHDMPTRSTLIGLAAAAMGIRRDNAAGQGNLASALVTASCLLQQGRVVRDFHTFQSLHQGAKGARTRGHIFTRANKDHIFTTITRREYWADGVWQAAYRLRDGASGLTLEALKQAFQRPGFFLSLGRRSCALSLPLYPDIVPAADVAEAFAARRDSIDRIKGLKPLHYSLEDPGDAPSPEAATRHLLRDDPVDRSIRWTFGERTEWRVGVGGGAE